MTTSLDKFNSKLFAAQLHTKFKVQLAHGGGIVLELVEVKESDPSPKIELFALQFLGPATPRLPQQIHRLEHEALGDFDLFLTAVGQEPEGIRYEAVFHRFRKPAS